MLRPHPATLVLFLTVGLASAQSLESVIPLDDGDPATLDQPFGIAIDPDGIHAYVSLAGTFASPNDKILKLDLIGEVVVAQATVGLFPEDVAITTDAAGAARHIYVTGSTSGTVSALDPNLSGASTIALPACPFGGTYPFGVLASPDGSRVLVTSVGCGDLHLLDSDPASPQFNTVASSFNLPGGHGRPSWVAAPLALVPRSTFDPSFIYGEAAFATVDVTAPGGAQSYPLLPTPLPGLYDAATDSAVLPSGLALITVGFGQGGYLFEVDPVSGVVTRSLAFGATSGDKLHGLGVDPDGRIAAVTFFSVASDVAFVDLASFTVLGTVSLGQDRQPNEAVFTPDGSRCLVTLQKSDGLAVIGHLPGYDLELDTTSVAPQGSTWKMALRHVEHGQPAALFVSISGNGPQVIGGETVLLSDPFWLFAEYAGDPKGGAAAQIPIPPAASGLLSGTTLYFQAATVDRSGEVRLSNGAQSHIP